MKEILFWKTIMNACRMRYVVLILLLLTGCQKDNHIPDCLPDLDLEVVRYKETPGKWAYDLKYNNDHLYLTNYDDGTGQRGSLNILNTKTWEWSSIIPDSDLYGTVDIEVQDNFLYVSTYEAGKVIAYDVSGSPVKLFVLDVPGAMGSGVHNSTLFTLSTAEQYVYAFDISDKRNVKFLSRFRPSAFKTPSSIEFYGKYAFVTGYDSDNLTVLDVSDPMNMKLVTRLINGGTSPGYFNGAYYSKRVGNTLYVSAYYGDSLTSIDVTDPTKPYIISSIPGFDGAGYFTIRNDMLYLSTRRGIAIFDISNPEALLLKKMELPKELDVWPGGIAVDECTSVFVGGYYNSRIVELN